MYGFPVSFKLYRIIFFYTLNLKNICFLLPYQPAAAHCTTNLLKKKKTLSFKVCFFFKVGNASQKNCIIINDLLATDIDLHWSDQLQKITIQLRMSNVICCWCFYYMGLYCIIVEILTVDCLVVSTTWILLLLYH